ncbi:hypothetical protein VNO77_04229 [Canavalia gladiata]|uniref:Uncharacterized protein n=1 Tax=Canavalia gladiata TaxID=3824 RepID=A0AAN9N1A3_CANGL
MVPNGKLRKHPGLTLIRIMPKGCLMFKVDLEKAFDSIVGIREEDHPYPLNSINSKENMHMMIGNDESTQFTHVYIRFLGIWKKS